MSSTLTVILSTLNELPPSESSFCFEPTNCSDSQDPSSITVISLSDVRSRGCCAARYRFDNPPHLSQGSRTSSYPWVVHRLTRRASLRRDIAEPKARAGTKWPRYRVQSRDQQCGAVSDRRRGPGTEQRRLAATEDCRGRRNRWGASPVLGDAPRGSG